MKFFPQLLGLKGFLQDHFFLKETFYFSYFKRTKKLKLLA
jgi:hypothetical protein